MQFLMFVIFDSTRMNFSRVNLLLMSLFAVVTSFESNKKVTDFVLDLTPDCYNNYITSVHLPYGAGSTDSRIVLLRSTSSLVRNCSLIIAGPHSGDNCKNKCATALVFEFFNYQKTNTSCESIVGGLVLRSQGEQFADVCTDVKKQSMKRQRQQEMQTYLIFKRKFVIDMHFTKFSGSIKMTATAAKYLGNYDNCSSTDEVYCILDGHVFCINKHLECDGNLNCGTPNLYDEYCSNLYVQENILFALVYGICLIAVVIFFLVQILRVCVPKVAHHFFIFNEEEEYNFVLTSQSLPPLKITPSLDETEVEREQTLKVIDTRIY